MKAVRAKHHRRGVSLIELIATFTLGTVMFSISVGWLHQSFKYSSAVNLRVRAHQSLIRLERHLRDHIHRCQTMAVVDDQQWALHLENGLQMVYRIRGNEIDVRMLLGDQLVSRDRFVVPKSSAIAWDRSAMPDELILTISRGIEGREVFTSENPSHENHSESPDVRLTKQMGSAIELNFRAKPQRWPGVKFHNHVPRIEKTEMQ